MKGLSHISLNSGNLEDAINFYTVILGGEKVFDFHGEEKDGNYGAFIAMGNGTFIEIFKRPNNQSCDEYVETPQIFRHLCFQVDSIQESAEWLKKFGFQVNIKLGKIDKVPQFFISGPDNVEIEFHEYCDKNPQYPFLN